MRRTGALVGGFALTAAFYLVLIDTASLPELLVLVAVALLGAAAFAISLAQGFTEATISIVWLLRAWRVLASVPLQILLVCREALSQLVDRRPARGELRMVPFHGGQAGRDIGRRALTESLGSFAPNTIVIGVDTERNLLLVHQLRRRGGDHELDVLRLG
jgi:hypothetical protein